MEREAVPFAGSAEFEGLEGRESKPKLDGDMWWGMIKTGSKRKKRRG